MNGKEQSSIAVHELPQQAFAFGGFRLEPDGTLFRGQTVVHLPPKELAALRVLLSHAGQVVTPLQLRRELWGDLHVTTESVPKCVSSLRSRLAPEDCLQTVYKRGYRLAADVRRLQKDLENALPRLAILPFEAGEGCPEHIALGVVEATIDRLVNMRPAMVSVLARDSVFALAGGSRTAQQVGRELNAGFVLSGILRGLPSHYRLRASMIRVEDGTEIWVEDVLVDRNRAGAIESELTDRLTLRLGGAALSVSATPGSSGSRATNGHQREAYDIYLRARFECQTLERHRLQDGMQQLVRATELDPSLTSAQVDLAYVCCLQAFCGFMAPRVAAEKVRNAAEAIRPSSEHAGAILPAAGWVKFHFDRDMKAAKDAFERSAHLLHDSRMARERAMFALSRHRFDEAIGLIQSALRDDPFSPMLQARMAWALHLAGEFFEERRPDSANAIASFPVSEWTPLFGAIILCFNGDVQSGIKLAAEFVQQHPYFDWAAAVHAYTLACAGRGDEARAILERLEWLGSERFVLRSFTPAAYLALGDRAAALTELRKADEARCPWFFQMLADPRLKPLGREQREFAQSMAALARMESAATAS